MEYKKSMIIIILAIFLFSIAGICASDTNDTTIASEDTTAIELSQSDDITVTDESQKTIQTNDTEMLTASDEETTAAQNNLDTLSLEEKTYADLSNAVGSGGDINLQPAYYKYNGESDTISITNPGIINGNGAIIDMTGSTIRAFTVSASAVTIKNLTIKNANYNSDGGAIYFSSSGTVTNCNFTNNTATYGGAVYFSISGTVTNCNFTGNTASGDGGAIRISSGTGTVTNCNFTGNNATNNGGAIWIYSGSVTNCNFINNNATYYGGAVYFFNTGTVTNCNFTNNQASANGGAVYFRNTGNVTNCNFTGNTASGNGGAIRISSGTVTNCNFTGNNATTGSSIFFNNYGSTKTISNSIFLNNLANAESLEIIKNDNNITITFKGKDNLLNAIFSPDDVNFANVTYWGANGIANTDSSTPSRSKNEAGQNITVGIVVNDKLVLDNVYVTDENGMIVLDISAGDNYYIAARHDTDSYYTEIEKTISNNTKFNVDVTSKTTNNKTVNITAKSNIFREVMPGKLLFILPNGVEINATYASNGTWWAVHTFDDYNDYQVNASYIGLDNVTITNATISITKANSTVNVSDVVMDWGDSTNVTVTAEGATGITAMIDNNPVSVINNYTIMILGLDVGTYNLTVATIPDENHISVNKTVTITVNKAKTEITASAITTTYNINKDLVITLKDSNGNALSGVEITVDLNGAKTYTTDANGQVKVSTKGLAPKAYTAKITFNGDDNYLNSTKDVKVTVKKAKPKITAKSKTYKVKTKNKKYTITLKDNKGKPIKNAKVRLVVKKITTKKTKKTKSKKKKNIAKTNKKGKATFKVYRSKKGKYKAAIIYKGNKYYTPLTKKVKITVK